VLRENATRSNQLYRRSLRSHAGHQARERRRANNTRIRFVDGPEADRDLGRRISRSAQSVMTQQGIVSELDEIIE
jgi:hypothetical protein